MKENRKAIKFSSLFSALILLSSFGFNSISYANEKPQAFSPQDSRIPGGIAVIPLKETGKELKVIFNGKKVWQLTDKNDKHWAIIGIPLKQKVGKVNYKIDGKDFSFTIKNKAYKEQHLTVKRKHSNPPEDQIKRIQKESRLSKVAFTTFSNINQDQAYENFLLPTQGPISSPFGLKRFFNEQARRPHSGIDIAAARGSDIIAPADGEIILTGNFFFNGNSIFIDHGQGLITLYCHMDQLESKTGDKVKAGDVIGKVGSTGRATGPHLHWTVSLNNSRIEPLLFLTQPNE
ncbi:MAG: peptidoglycan DD-metalloendopeptidase family protein [Oleispira sp.]|nr:peptidoglycan DD-metalloendopeptidase family protein [Oleispira sp.]MBL4880258.1 peptidoglycan DD-metalloendopeptidase family protein [Oleispira sp.]